MKLKRIHIKDSTFRIPIEIVSGPINETKIEKLDWLTFGYSCVVDSNGLPYTGRYNDYYGSIDFYFDETFMIGVRRNYANHISKGITEGWGENCAETVFGKCYSVSDVYRGTHLMMMEIKLPNGCMDRDFRFTLWGSDRHAPAPYGDFCISKENVKQLLEALEYYQNCLAEITGKFQAHNNEMSTPRL